MEVSAQSTLHSLFGKDLDEQDYDVYPDEYPFSPFTVELIHIWDLIDGFTDAEHRLKMIKGMPDAMGRELVAA